MTESEARAAYMQQAMTDLVLRIKAHKANGGDSETVLGIMTHAIGDAYAAGQLAERERCAKICESQMFGEAHHWKTADQWDWGYDIACKHCLEAIQGKSE